MPSETIYTKPVITLALDIATMTGWAKKTPGHLYSGVLNFNLKPGEGAGMRYHRFSNWLNEMWYSAQLLQGAYPTTRVVYEKPIRFPGRNTDVQAGLVGVMLEWCERMGIAMYEAVPPSVIKKHATGKGNVEKCIMVAAALDKWPDQFPKNEPPDDNRADALWLLDWALNN